MQQGARRVRSDGAVLALALGLAACGGDTVGGGGNDNGEVTTAKAARSKAS